MSTTGDLRRAVAALFAMALLAAGCGGAEEAAPAGDATGAAPEAAAGGSPEAAAPDAAEQENSLAEAYREDPAALGLEPLEPPDDDIEVRQTDQYAKEGPYRIAFASQGPTNSWAQIYDASLQSHAEELGVEVLYADANGSADKQVNDIEDLLVQQPDALIVTPLGAAVTGAVERAAAQNIPVVLCTGRLDTDAYVTRVDRSNTLNGTLAAEWIAEQIGGEGKVVMLSGIAGVPTAEDRLAAAQEVFAGYPDIEIVAQEYTNWSPTEGKQVMEGILVANPEIDAIWSDSGIQNIGAIEALNEAGRDIPPMTAEPLNGFLRLAQENDVPFAAIGYPPSHSAQCLDAAVSALQGEPLPSFINVDAPVFTDAEIGEFYREECSDDLWVPTELSDEQLAELNLCPGG